MLDPQWKECLYDRYRWVGRVPEGEDLVRVVERVLSVVEAEVGPLVSVHQSSVGAVCMAYLMHRGVGGFVLSDPDLGYTRARGGVIGCCMVGGKVVLTTLRQFLEARDLGFACFMGSIHHQGPPAA